MVRPFMLLLGMIYAIQTWSFPCFITLAKDNCWLTYNVTVNVIDGSTGKIVTSVVVPEGELWARAPFICRPDQTLIFSATFLPVFWESDAGKVYSAQHDLTLPAKVAQGETAWNIPLCFPAAFAEVPFPPEGTNHCECDMSKIPPVKPQ